VTAGYAIGKIGVVATAGIAGIETLTSGSMTAGPAAGLSVGAVF